MNKTKTKTTITEHELTLLGLTAEQLARAKALVAGQRDPAPARKCHALCNTPPNKLPWVVFQPRTQSPFYVHMTPPGFICEGCGMWYHELHINPVLPPTGAHDTDDIRLFCDDCALIIHPSTKPPPRHKQSKLKLHAPQTAPWGCAFINDKLRPPFADYCSGPDDVANNALYLDYTAVYFYIKGCWAVLSASAMANYIYLWRDALLNPPTDTVPYSELATASPDQGA